MIKGLTAHFLLLETLAQAPQGKSSNHFPTAENF